MKYQILKFAAIAMVCAPFSAVSLPGFGTGSAYAGCSDTAAAGVDWSDCRKRNLIMSGSDFSGSNLSGADLSSSDLREANFTNANLSKANLVRASLKGVSATNSDFSRILASRSNFSNGDFTNADFSKAETSRVDFSSSTFTSADMSKAEFARANFSGSQMSGVNFDFSNLARADLRGITYDKAPSFKNSFLYQTRLEGLDLSGSTELQVWQINLACGDENTVLPSGMERPETWPCSDDS